MIAGMVYLARKYAPEVNTEEIKQNIGKSVYDQLLNELKRDQILDGLRRQQQKQRQTKKERGKRKK